MQHWVFDLDGTLIDSFPSYRSVLVDVLTPYGIKLSEEDLSHSRHVVLPKYLERFVPPSEVAVATKKVIDISLTRQHEIKTFQGIEEVLDSIKSQDCQLSVWTARELLTARSILKETGLHRYFENLVSRDCVAVTKPHPEGLLKILNQSQSCPKKTIMIGDHPMDIHGARAAGVKAVSVGWGTDMTDAEAISDHHFDEIPEFHNWVKKTLNVI